MGPTLINLLQGRPFILRRLIVNWLFWVGQRRKRVLTGTKEIFRKFLQVHRPGKRGGESSSSREKPVGLGTAELRNSIRMPSHMFPRACADESQVPEGRNASLV